MTNRYDLTTEAEFQGWILNACQRLRLAAYHTHDSRRSEKGFPDLVIVGMNGILYRELKKQDGVVSVEQRYWLSILQESGADVAVWRPNLWPEQIMRDLCGLGRLTTVRPEKVTKIVRLR